MITSHRWLVLFLCLSSLTLLCANVVPVCAQEPGTTGDPLVSKSYLDQFFRFHSLVVPGGQKLPLQQGALLVLRSGKCRIVGPKGKALLDLTDGKEIPAGAVLPPLHLILVADAGDLQLEAQAMCQFMAQGLRPRK
ncbi:MAG TPA: hypothetical protein PKO06_11115 [Candidatus Ozemobacteraceae bacterium]|nr:hypothetical protein [Candidatus Ozemobacteraceae bacterium]